MRVGVIRGDVPSPIFLADFEPTSQFNPPTEPYGQSRYLSRPDPTVLTNFLAGLTTTVNASAFGSIETAGGAIYVDQVVGGVVTKVLFGGVPAGIEGTAITFPVSLAGANVLKVKNTLAGSFVTVTITSGSYATMALLLAAANTALTAASAGVTATTDTATGTLFVLQSTVPGVGSYVAVGTTGSGSSANTPLNLAAGGTSFTMPTASTIITDLNPVAIPPATGSINVSAANLLTVLGASPATAAVANFIAPQFQETQDVVQSYQTGMLAKYLELAWTPDSRRLPAITAGPAIQVVEDDGHTAFSSSVGPQPGSTDSRLPMISAAVHNSPNTGDITITGVGIGNAEFFDGTTVLVKGANSGPSVRLTQKQIISPVTDGVALTGTFSVTNGSPTVTASLSQAGLLLAGNNIVFGSQPGVIYEVSTVVTTTVTLTTNYTGIANPLTTAKTPVTQGVVTNTSIVIPAVLLTPVGGTGLGVVGSTVEVKYETYANTNYGSSATVSAWAANVSTLTGLVNQQASQVGSYITVSGAVNAGNNGTFQILSRVSATSITIANVYGVFPDANSGALVWSEPPPVAFVVT